MRMELHWQEVCSVTVTVEPYRPLGTGHTWMWVETLMPCSMVMIRRAFKPPFGRNRELGRFCGRRIDAKSLARYSSVGVGE